MRYEYSEDTMNDCLTLYDDKEELRKRKILQYYDILVNDSYREGLILKRDLSYNSLLRHHLMSVAEWIYDYHDGSL